MRGIGNNRPKPVLANGVGCSEKTIDDVKHAYYLNHSVLDSLLILLSLSLAVILRGFLQSQHSIFQYF